MTCGKKILIVLAAALAVAGPAYAITGGTPDGQGHPAVGLLLADAGPAGFQPDCTGALVAPDVFVTAAHCFIGTASNHVLDHLRRAGFAARRSSSRDRVPRSGVQHGQEGSARPRGRQAARAGHRRDAAQPAPGGRRGLQGAQVGAAHERGLRLLRPVVRLRRRPPRLDLERHERQGHRASSCGASRRRLLRRLRRAEAPRLDDPGRHVDGQQELHRAEPQLPARHAVGARVPRRSSSPSPRRSCRGGPRRRAAADASSCTVRADERPGE